MELSDSDSISCLKSRIRAPILWIMIPLVLGYIIARKTPQLPFLFLLVFGGMLSAIWIIAWWKRYYRQLYWRVFGVICVFLLSWGYLLLHLPSHLDWTDKPQREVNLTLKVTQVRPLEDKYSRQAGYAEIVNAPKHLGVLIGQKVSFFLSPGDKTSETLVRSQVVKAKGLISPILENSDNPFENYLFSQGISFKLNRGVILETEFDPSSFFKFCKNQNEHLEAILAKGKSIETADAVNIYSAMLLGNQASLTPEQKYAFQITGSLHLFSISGLHVAMVAACIAFFLRSIRLPNALAAIIGLIILFLYVEITGGSPSAMRAFLMVFFYWGAMVFRRKKSAFSALLASALVALVINPFDLWNIGFQLSYVVVGSILLYGVPLNEVINNWINTKFVKMHSILKYCIRWFLNLIGISLAANIGSTFLSILYFKTFAPGAVLLSIAVIPLASLVIVIGCISLLLGVISLPMLSGLINPISWFIIKIIAASIAFSLKISGLFWESFAMPSILTYISLGILLVMLYLGHVFNKLQRSSFYSLPIILIIFFISLGRYIV